MEGTTYKEFKVFEALRQSLEPHGIVNNMGREYLLGQLIGEQMACEYCPVESDCVKSLGTHYCGEFIRDNYILNPNRQ